MDQNLSNEDKEKKFYEDRVRETEDLIAKEFKRIFSKRHANLTDEEIGFLQARESYLSKAEQEEYKEELGIKLGKTQDSADKAGSLDDLTRKELEAKLQEFGIKDTSIKVYPKNADLIIAIQELQG